MKWPLWRRRQDRQLDEELRSHLALAIQDRIDRGESAEHAAAAARREFGSLPLVRDTVRDTWGWTPIEQLWQDLGQAVRTLVKAPAFTIAAVLTLSLGIGANTAMFSVVRAVILRPLPFAEPNRLVELNETDLRSGAPQPLSVSWPDYFDWRRDTRTLQSVAAYHPASFTVTGLGPARHVPGAVVTANLFSTLGVEPSAGRGFRDEEDRTGADAVIVSEAFRQNYLGKGIEPVGRPLILNGRSFTIVGVAPPHFSFPVVSPPLELWVTVAQDRRVESPGDSPITEERGAHYIQVVGRMRPDADLAGVQAELRNLATRLAQSDRDDHAHRGSLVRPLLDAIVGTARQPLLLLLAAVGFVLLIACVNLANLMASRAIARRPELALRAALGASRSRVVRLLLAEAFAIAIAAAAGGIVMAWWSLDLLVALAPRDIRGLDQVSIDSVVLVFTALTAAGCGLLFGLAPAFGATRGNPREELGSTRTSTAGRAQRRWLNSLIVVETGLGVVLLVGATLVLGGLDRLAHTDPGFDARQLATMRVSLPDGRYPFLKRVAFYDRLLSELDRLPGVEGAGLVGPLPLSGSRYTISFELPGDRAAANEKHLSAGFTFVSPGYFRVMRTPVRQGREFTSADTDTSPRTVVVNESFAQRYFPGESPIGKRIKPGLSTTETDTPWREIVGVVSDTKQQVLNESANPAYFVPLAQGLITTPHLVVRAGGQVEAIAESVRRVVAAADPELAVFDVRALEERRGDSMASQRFTTFLLSAFAGLGLLLTAIGLYGVLAYSVTQRMHEFAVRLALGARPGDILSTVMAVAVKLAGAGLLIGAAAAAALTRTMMAILDFVQRPDLLTLGTVVTTLLVVALAAACAPARKAMRVDPMQTLRSS